jgi:hypothetical protein
MTADESVRVFDVSLVTLIEFGPPIQAGPIALEPDRPEMPHADDEEKTSLMKAAVTTQMDDVTDDGNDFIAATLHLDEWKFSRCEHHGVEVLVIHVEGQTQSVHVMLRPELARILAQALLAETDQERNGQE